jgi:D-alanyl-lipoteichoic acid acyltransferase DltB (MBOAT superfamily)
MLFNSYEFLFAFFPLCVIGFFLLARSSEKLATLWLVGASLFFYAWWSPRYLALLLASIAMNFVAGRAIASAAPGTGKRLLTLAVAANLVLLAVFKYAGFFVHEANRLGLGLPELAIILPIGISFFTFTQIAYLVDAHRGQAREYNPLHYALFVTWFPHLISGPVLHHKQMMPQFANPATYLPSAESFAVGMTMFVFGLAKKVLLADQFALYASPVFGGAERGSDPLLFNAWVGAIAYALQLYFDFSGYSDMALGISRVFNVKLPLNFNSPYKSASIIEFWRLWHMTLSAFLRDYLYFSLGGNKHGTARRYLNLMITMLLGGLWHGAGWGFILWGGLHGLFLVLNHLWRTITPAGASGILRHTASVLLTFVVVVVAWVPFRSHSLEGALGMLRGMAGLNGVSLPQPLSNAFSWLHGASFNGLLPGANYSGSECVAWLAAGMAMVWFVPNSQQLLARFCPAWDTVAPVSVQWSYSRFAGVAVGVLFGCSVMLLNRTSEFLYFQF